MALLPILQLPDPRLRERGARVETFDEKLHALIADMFETMYAAPGIGLAATQVGVSLQLAVMDCSEAHNEQRVLINPEVLAEDDLEEMEEGCLSIPDVQEKVRRYNHITVRAQDAAGQSYEIKAEGLLAQCLQHEIDHLNGKLFVDYLSRLKRDRIKKKMVKLHKREQ
ncbi:MAG: peptide deformylase [Nevskiaceae bacterium]|nr:MAG: peptide deformylase [Nevskiaceae bacterium]TBR72572.1 MAG: peptide deformylase [Nevskiaceae bacterium]